MNRAVLCCKMAFLLCAAGGCAGWRKTPQASASDAVVDPFVLTADSEHRLSFRVPGGWYWVTRDGYFIATRDGVYLQNILVEYIHASQVAQSDLMFPSIVYSAREWPLRTVKSLNQHFAAGMCPTDVAEVVLASHRKALGVTDLEVREIVTQSVAGTVGFKVLYEFRLNLDGRKVPYRAIQCGFMREDWYFGISYTAALRHYFQKDAGVIDSILSDIQFVERIEGEPDRVERGGHRGGGVKRDERRGGR